RAALCARTAARTGRAGARHGTRAGEMMVLRGVPAAGSAVPAVSLSSAMMNPSPRTARQVAASSALARWAGSVAAVLVVVLLAGGLITSGQKGATTGPVWSPAPTEAPQPARPTGPVPINPPPAAPPPL